MTNLDQLRSHLADAALAWARAKKELHASGTEKLFKLFDMVNRCENKMFELAAKIEALK